MNLVYSFTMPPETPVETTAFAAFNKRKYGADSWSAPFYLHS